MTVILGVSQIISRESVEQNPSHDHNTRFQSRLRLERLTAMNDASSGDLLSDGMDTDSDTIPSPRLGAVDSDMLGTGGPDSSDSESESALDSEMASDSESDIDINSSSDISLDVESVLSRSSSSWETIPISTESDDDFIVADEDFEPESGEASSAESAQDPSIPIDIDDFIEYLRNRSNAGSALDGVDDKLSYLAHIGIDLSGANEFSQNQDQINAAQQM